MRVARLGDQRLNVGQVESLRACSVVVVLDRD